MAEQPRKSERMTDEFRTEIGDHIRTLFEEAERQRRETEDRWVRDLRQYKGEYPPEVQSNFQEDQSQVFVRMTRKKVRTIDARLRDMLFPQSKERNWSIEPTEIPELGPEEEQKMAMSLAQNLGREPRQVEIDEAKAQYADEKAANMARVMQDQLEELRYEEIVGRDVIHSGTTYGTGIFKGPLVDTQMERRWRQGESGWQVMVEQEFRPHIEFVPIWDIYPDMAARDFSEVQYVFQRHLMPRFEVVDLAKRPDFDTEAIKAYLEDHPKGDADRKNFEHYLREMGERDQNPPDENGRYELIEYWGVIDGQQAEELGLSEDLPQGDRIFNEFWANVWMLGDIVVKSVLTPLEGINHPFHAFYFDKDETSIFGEGVPTLLRDDQAILNSGTRAMLDNAALAAGFIGEANVDLLEPGQDPRKIHPRKMFLRRGTGDEARIPAVNQIPLQPYTESYLQIVQSAERWGHEHTVPAYMGGSNEGGGPADTARGLSMLMENSNVEINDLVRNFDNGITKRFISALYNWNMMFSDREDIKGDFKIKPEGSASLVAKEVREQNIFNFGQAILQDPGLRTWVKEGKFVQEAAEVTDIPDEMIRSHDEHQRMMEQKSPSAEEIEAQVEKQEAQIKALEAEVNAQEKLARAEKARADALLTQVQAANQAGGSVEVNAIDNAINGEEPDGQQGGGAQGASGPTQQQSGQGPQGPTPARSRGAQKATPNSGV